MAGPYKVDLRVADCNGFIFSDTTPGDFIIRAQTSNKSVHLGAGSNAFLTVNPVKTIIKGDLEVTAGTITVCNIVVNGSSGGLSQWSNSNSNVFIQGSNVGIGLSNPSAPLEVAGTIKASNIEFTGQLLQNGTPFVSGNGGASSQWSNTGSNVFIQGSNIGIGISNPSAPLEVAGTIKATNINFTGQLQQNGTPYIGSQWSNTASNVFITGSNVGIGLATPVHALDVDGAIRFSSNVIPTSNATQSIGSSTALLSNVYTTGVRADTALIVEATDTTITGNVTISGNVTVTGCNFVANVQTVEVTDNIMLLNKGETGAGVTAGTAGLYIDRGTTSNPYQVIFDETTDTLKVGFSNALETAATREWTSNNTFNRAGGFLSGPIYENPADSSNAPSYSFSNDTNTGMFHVADGALGFAAKGSNIMTLCNTAIQMNTSVAFPGPLNLSGMLITRRTGAGATNVSAQPQWTNFGTNVYIPTGSNLGVGLSNPAYPLEVAGTLNATSICEGGLPLASNYLARTGGSMTGPIQQSQSDSVTAPGYTWSNDSNTGMYHAGSGAIAFATSGSNVATLSNNALIVGASGTGQVSANNLGLFRNRIINGDMRIDQRFAGNGVGGLSGCNQVANVQPSSFYTVDRWAVSAPNVGAVVAKQVTLSSADQVTTGGFQNAVQLGLAPADQLALYLPFEGTVSDASSNAVAATTNGSMAYGPGVVGSNSLYLANEGTGSNYIYYPYTAQQTFTISCWMMCTSNNAAINKTIWSITNPTGATWGLQFVINGSMALYLTNNFVNSSTATIGLNQWYHTAVTYTVGSNFLVYVNGSNVASGTMSSNMTGSNGSIIVGASARSPSLSSKFPGMIDDFRIYSRALSATEIAALANNVGVPAAPTTVGLSNWLTFNQTSADSTSNLPAPVGSAVYSPVCVTDTGALDVTANTVGAANASTSLTYTSATAYTLPITLSAWFNASSNSSSTQTIACIGNNTAGFTNSISLNTLNNTITLTVNATVNTNLSTRAFITVGNWYHCVTTVTANSYANIYINGTLVFSSNVNMASLTVGGTGSSGTPTQLSIGASTGTNSNNPFKGLIDDVRVYNRVLSSTEVAGLYASTVPAGYTLFQQTIEGANLWDLGWGTSLAKPVTGSMWIKNNTSTPQTFSVSAANAAAKMVTWLDFEGSNTTDRLRDKAGILTNGTLTGSGFMNSNIFKVGSTALDLSANTVGSTASTYVDFNVPLTLQTPLTVSMWLYPSAMPNANGFQIPLNLTSKTIDLSGSWSFNIGLDSSSNVYINYSIGGSTTSGSSNAAPISVSNWAHVCCTLQGNIANIYVNGLQSQSISIPTGPFYNAVATTATSINVLRLGCRAPSGQPLAYKGLIDDVRIYNTALSPTTIAQLYANNANSIATVTYVTPRYYVSPLPPIPANSWQQVSFTIPGDTTGSWITTNDAGLTLSICLGASANFNTASSNQWLNNVIDFTAGSNQVYTTSANNFLASLSNNILITGVQLEVGNNVTPFEFRPFGTELQLCQRYFEKSYLLNQAVGSYTIDNFARVSFGYNTNWFNDPTVTYSTSKKSTNTTFMLYSPNTGAPMTLKYANASTNLAVSYYNPYVYSSLNTFSTAFTTLTGGQAYVYHWTADSEF